MKLKRSKKGEFVPVIKNNKIYYGGYQNDLKEVGVSKFYRDRSCVVTAFTNTYLYLYRKDEKFSLDQFNDYQYWFFQIIKPRVYGVPTARLLDFKLNKFRKSYHLKLKSHILEDNPIKRKSMEEIANFIFQAIEKDLPVIFFNWVSRSIRVMKHHGVTITEIKGRYGGYILENKDYLLNLELSDNESLSLSKTKDFLKGQGLHFYNDLSSAIEKIKTINPKDNNYDSENIYNKGIKIKANNQEESEKWLTINDGILNNRKLRIKYMDSKGCCTERIVQPYKLYTYYGSNYFIGQCEERNELRQFKLVRIKNIELLEDRFIKDDFDINEYLKNSIGLFKDKTYKIKLIYNLY